MILVATLFTASCKSIPVKSGSISFRDGKSNDYLIRYEDNTETKLFKALVDVKGKTYSCEVDYTAAAPNEIAFGIDISALDITGKVMFTYKAVTVECSVEKNIPGAVEALVAEKTLVVGKPADEPAKTEKAEPAVVPVKEEELVTEDVK